MKIKIWIGTIIVCIIASVGYSSIHADSIELPGSGTEMSPYMIATCADLNQINLDLNAHYALSGDIDCSATNPADESNESSPWTDGHGFSPIGKTGLIGANIYGGFLYYNFTGTLNGQGHTISDLYINRGSSITDVEGYYTGLFATIGVGGEVKNLGLVNVNITASAPNTGSFAGGLSGTLTNVYSTGEVHGYINVGGLVGVHVDSNSFPNSSPLVYSWNGEKYTYTNDVGSLLPKELNGIDVASIDSEDIAPKDGKYSFKIAEEYNETVYYDELALMTFDHQPGYTVVEPINTTAGVNELRTISDTPTHPLLSCVDDTGADCTTNLKDYDDKWSYTNNRGQYDTKNLKKYWILDFGDLSNATSTQLVFRGARDYAASAQYPGNSVRSVQVKNAQGAWVEVYNKNQLGSDGTARLRTLDMTGKFLTTDHRIKVAFDTFNANYFAIDTSAQVPFTTHTYHPDSATLGFNGFTAIDRTYFYDHDYSKVSPFPEGIFKNQYGNFTKYGDVNPLLTASDDHFVVMKSGDQMSVEFPYDAVPEGMERSFMLYNNVFYKHATYGDLGVIGQSANYLPYNGMTSYGSDMVPYPSTPENLEYIQTWNTRTLPGPFADAMRTGGSTIIGSHSSADIYAVRALGGLVGLNQKEIRYSYATGDIHGGEQAGGLVGVNQSNQVTAWIHDSYATGDIIGNSNLYYRGGLVGINNALIERSYATGHVPGDIGNYNHGLVGYNSGGDEGGIVDSFSDTQVSGKTNVGNGGTDKTTSEMKNVATFTNLNTTGLGTAWDFVGTPNNDAGTDDIWNISLEVNDGYPYIYISSEDTPAAAPVISEWISTSTASTITFTWSTDLAASTMLLYSVYDGGYASSTEQDTESRVTNHNITLSGLVPCTTYFIKLVSTGDANNTGVSEGLSLNTTGCTANSATGENILGEVTVSASATTSLELESSKTLQVVTPADFTSTSSSIVIQIKALDQGSVLGLVGTPTGASAVGGVVFDVKALINATTTLDSFDVPVTIVHHYLDSDIEGVDESTLALFHYHDGIWSRLDACVVNATTNTITCTTPNFSIFGLFAVPVVVTPSTPSPTPTSGGWSTPTGGSSGGSSYTVAPITVTTSTTTPKIPVVTVSTTTAPYIFTRTLTSNNIHPEVKTLQQFLNAHGFTVAKVGAGSPGLETTKFGPATKAALIRFQKAYKITPAVGFFGPVTRKVIEGMK